MNWRLAQAVIVTLIYLSLTPLFYIYDLMMHILFHNPIDFRGKVVMITGAGNGLGRHLAQRLAKHNAKLFLLDIDESCNRDTVQSIIREGGEACALKCDITKSSEIDSAVHLVLSRYNSIDILVHCAGIVNGKSLLQLSEEEIDKVLSVNLLSTIKLTKLVLPHLLEKNSGHIVFIASAAGILGISHLTDYCASKFGVVGFSLALKKELEVEGKHVNVTCVCPHLIDTGMFKGASGGPFGFLNVDDAVTTIIDAIKENWTIVTIPQFIYQFVNIINILPYSLQRLIYSEMETDTVMKNFVGRPKQQ